MAAPPNTFVVFVEFVTAVDPIAETNCAAVATVCALVPFPYKTPVRVPATPVPPYKAPITDAFHVPVAIAPLEFI